LHNLCKPLCGCTCGLLRAFQTKLA
jgi:hypothetical protein